MLERRKVFVFNLERLFLIFLRPALSPCWHRTHRVAKDDFELLIFMLPFVSVHAPPHPA